jgi:hypothetical protein
VRVIAVFCVLIALAGCGPDANMTMYDQTQSAKRIPVQDDGRVQVTRIGVFGDDLAYGGKRGVYLIKDEKTGREYVGLSGIGISEIGSHSVASGKVIMQHPDER